MNKTKFTLYGLLIGVVCAAYGSAIFALLAVINFYSYDTFIENVSDVPMDLIMVFVWGTLFSAMFSALPGAIGGAYLANWLGKDDRTPKEIKQRGLIVGAMADVITLILVLTVYFHGSVFDIYTLGYSALATLITMMMSWFAASLLAKDKKKFITSNPLP